eukprot:2086975-Pyramimonas_sp.AAC.1
MSVLGAVGRRGAAQYHNPIVPSGTGVASAASYFLCYTGSANPTSTARERARGQPGPDQLI